MKWNSNLDDTYVYSDLAYSSQIYNIFKSIIFDKETSSQNGENQGKIHIKYYQKYSF